MNTQSKTFKGQCQSCLMPFAQDPMKEKRESDMYCSYCFVNGKFTCEGDVHTFQRQCYEGMIKNGHFSPWQATIFSFMSRFAPRWKNEWQLIRGIY